MQILTATEKDRGEVISLLKQYNLPAADLPTFLAGFYTAIADGRIVGLIGMERYGQYGLLRSMVVDSNYRNQHIAETLVGTLEAQATASGISDVYLLTETAAAYFSKKGYQTVEREEVPVAIKASSEFSYVCPASATIMKKSLIDNE